jgi:hypothetical protein
MTIRIVLLRAVFRDSNEESSAKEYNPREATDEITPPVQRPDDSFRESLAVRLYRARLPTFKAVSTSKIRSPVTIGDQALSTNENGLSGHSGDLPVQMRRCAICIWQRFCNKDDMRRKIFEEPVSRSATWSRRMAWMGIAVTGIAVFLTRSGRIEHEPGLTAILSGIAFGVLAMILALAAFTRIWMEGKRGLGSAIGGFVLAILLLALPAYIMAIQGVTAQPRDISTDPTNPPEFSRSPVALSARSGWIGGQLPIHERTSFRRAHPGLSPVVLDMAHEDAVAIARRAAAATDLTIIETEVPDEGRTSTRIEARTHSLMLRLPVEVTIRVMPVGEAARIDARAAAPVGNYDLGGNVAVLRAYLDEVAFLANAR